MTGVKHAGARAFSKHAGARAFGYIACGFTHADLVRYTPTDVLFPKRKVESARTLAREAIADISKAIDDLSPEGAELWVPGLTGTRDALRAALKATKPDARDLTDLKLAAPSTSYTQFVEPARILENIPDPRRAATIGVPARWAELLESTLLGIHRDTELAALAVRWNADDVIAEFGSVEAVRERASTIISSGSLAHEEQAELFRLLHAISEPGTELRKAAEKFGTGTSSDSLLASTRIEFQGLDKTAATNRLLELAQTPPQQLGSIDVAEFALRYRQARISEPLYHPDQWSLDWHRNRGIDRYQFKANAEYVGGRDPHGKPLNRDTYTMAFQTLLDRPMTELTVPQLEQLRSFVERLPEQAPLTNTERAELRRVLDQRTVDALEQLSKPASKQHLTDRDLALAEAYLYRLHTELTPSAETGGQLRDTIASIRQHSSTDLASLRHTIETRGLGDLTPAEQVAALTTLVRTFDDGDMPQVDVLKHLVDTARQLQLTARQDGLLGMRLAQALPGGYGAMTRQLAADLTTIIERGQLPAPTTPIFSREEVANALATAEDKLRSAAERYTYRKLGPVRSVAAVITSDIHSKQVQDAMKHRPPSAKALRALQPEFSALREAAAMLGPDTPLREVVAIAASIARAEDAVRHASRSWNAITTPYHQLRNTLLDTAGMIRRGSGWKFGDASEAAS